MQQINPLLYVEDDEDTFNAVKMLLETQGYEVQWAVNGKDALKLIAKENHSLVLLDIMLPDMSGWEILEEIHSQQPLQKVIFLSSIPISEERTKVLEREGVMDYIMKPFDKDDLIMRVNKAIENH